jgi:hypothetical protein
MVPQSSSSKLLPLLLLPLLQMRCCCCQVLNKVVAAELIFIATTNFDRALYTEGCDVEHLLEGLGGKGITRLFHNLSILAWAVVIAKVRQQCSVIQ